MPGRPPAKTAFRALAAGSLALAVSACVDETGPTGSGGWSVPLDLRPQLQVDLGLFPSSPIDRIRLTATAVETSQTISEADLSVDPQASQWELSLAIDLGDASSLDVLVTVELLSGETVAWSGRLGPLTVERNGKPQIRSVDVHRGPLDNLDVVALSLSGAPSRMSVGATIQLGAELTLAQGVGDIAPIVYWATTDPTVATITGTGTFATLTAVGTGSVDVVAVAGSTHDEATIEVVSLGYDVEWLGTTTDWFDAANWSTGQVPGPTDDVYIGPAAAYPALTSDVAVGSLGVAEGASLTTSAGVGVDGDMLAQGPILGGGFVQLTGTGVMVEGTVEGVLEVVGTATASGSLGVGALDVRGALSTGTHAVTVCCSVTVTGTLTVPSDGSLTIGDGVLTLELGSTLHVDGAVNAVACIDDGATITGIGIHPCGGASAGTRNWTGAVGSDWHTAGNWAEGAVPTLADDVVIPTSTTPVLSGDAEAGSLSLSDDVVLALGGYTLTVSGEVVQAAGAAIQGGEVLITGQGTMLTGTFADLRIAGPRALSGFLIASGSLYLDAPLAVGPQSVSVAGDLTIAGAGMMQMQDAESLVSVAGDVTFDGAGHSNVLTAGTLEVGGHFAALTTNARDSFRSSGTLVYFAGSNSQVVTLADPQTQTFADLWVLKSTGGSLDLANTIHVAGDLQAQQSILRAPAPGPIVEVRGRATATAVTFQGVPLRIVSPTGILPSDHLLRQLTFTDMPVDVPQLYISMAGRGTTEPLLLDTPAFQTVPNGETGFYVQAVNSAATLPALVINVVSPSPSTADGLTLTDQLSQIVWPF